MHTEHPSIDDNDNARPSPENSPDDVPDQLCTLYFKGLVSEENSLAGFGVAIFGKKNEILFQVKGPIHHDSTITVLEAEVTALIRRLLEAASMGITHISVYCDSYPVYEFVMGRYIPEDNKTALLMMDLQRIILGFKTSLPIFVEGTSISYAYNLARETIASEISIHVPMDPPHQAKVTLKTSCNICLDDAINADEMFCVDKCRHRLCFECMKRHIEIRLLEGSVIKCPYFRCKSKLTFYGCENLLTPKLRKMSQQRIKEDAIPVSERIYCPNPRCSALMSETELSKSTGAEVRRLCFKCGVMFCINCKVSWHSNMSCDVYKGLHPYPTENDRKIKILADQKLWRQCPKCRKMIELSEGCVRVKCRCGQSFCYRCGVKAGGCQHGHGLPPTPPQQPSPPPPAPEMPPAPAMCFCLICFTLLIAFIVYLALL